MMAKSWKSFMRGLEQRAQAEAPEHLEGLRALRGHFERLGEELAAEREKLGMSQSALADATGIDQAEISRIERSLVEPRLGTYVKLLEGMGLGLRVEPLVSRRSSVRRSSTATQSSVRRRSATQVRIAAKSRK